MTRLAAKAEQTIARCREIAGCTEVAGEITRTFLAASMHDAHALLRGWMEAAGMQVHVDAAGNLRGLWPGLDEAAPRLVIGSHLDTVANAGAFDGVLGVVLGVALVEELAGTRLPFAIEVIGFSEEEGVRFSKPFLGSLAVIGELDASWVTRQDRDGATVADAIRQFGLDPAAIKNAVLDGSSFGYLEFHIEQGPVLEAEHRSLGVVDAIAGQTRMTFTFTGQANHAGTTPMGALRHDALAAAAAWIGEVERYASAREPLVATVGKLEIPGAAGNVIPGRCAASLDVRHADDTVREAAVRHLIDFAKAAATLRGVSVAYEISLEKAAVPMDRKLTSMLTKAVEAITGEARVLTSGAGHDAMIVARRLPAAMLFLRSPGGLSHHPDEVVLVDDVEAALSAGVEFLRSLRDDSAMIQELLSERGERNA